MQNIIPVGCDCKYYSEHWREMAPAPPASCPFDGCRGKMHRHGFYWRSVITYVGYCLLFGVFRFRCTICKRTVSFLPDFCVPYKHFSTGVIGAVLRAVLILNVATCAVAAADIIYNKASFSRYCVYDWLAQFRRNSHNLWYMGLTRLGIAAAPAPDAEAVLFRHLAGFGAVSSGESACRSLRPAQCALSGTFPPFGLFRAHLLPGCCT